MRSTGGESSIFLLFSCFAPDASGEVPATRMETVTPGAGLPSSTRNYEFSVRCKRRRDFGRTVKCFLRRSANGPGIVFCLQRKRLHGTDFCDVVVQLTFV